MLTQALLVAVLTCANIPETCWVEETNNTTHITACVQPLGDMPQGIVNMQIMCSGPFIYQGRRYNINVVQNCTWL